ncbi:MAG: DegV family EDD domain-containing protein [Candidatus Cloacimonetes bacterium]|nr:DegV family EDD domain-containing protein [Candidatus Cloacimonadota bacterium]
MKIRYIDGNRLYNAFLAGGAAVISQQDYLNKINVFPVPDADTGTNLASTMRSIIEGSRLYRSLKKTARSIADSALIGARGNSGIIFAQFIHGLSMEMEDGNRTNVRDFAKTARSSLKYVYESIMEPVEGTMITVIKDWVNSLDEQSSRTTDFSSLIAETLKVARKSLADTPKKLKVLADAGVVDAGGKGFVDFLEGIWEFISRGKLKRVYNLEQLRGITIEPLDHVRDHLTGPRFCTEAVISNCRLSLPRFREKIKNYGDSLIIAGSPEKMRIHIHSDDPAQLFYQIKNWGVISQLKVDDMQKQFEVSHQRKYPIALVTDTSCDLPEEIISSYQIQRIPFSLSFGDNLFLDKITITPEQFYEMLKNNRNHPTSSQPSRQTIQNFYSFLTSHYRDIVAVHISDKLTGIYQATKSVAEKFENNNISVINSRQLTVSLGLIVLRIAKDIAAGKDFNEINRLADEYISKTDIFVDVNTLKYMVRGGRVSPFKGALAGLLNLKPIVSLDAEGKAAAYGKSFSRRVNMKKITAIIENIARKNALWNYAIVHAQAESRAKEYGQKLTDILGIEPAYIMNISPVVGVHNGIGAIGIGIMRK